jgi:hypothetical protein
VRRHGAGERPRDRLGRLLPHGAAEERLHPEGPASVAATPEEALAVAVELCGAGRFFEAHELLEHAWNVETVLEDRELWKGLTQIAVGCCHLQRGNPRGASRLLERGARRLAGYPARHRGVDVSATLDAVARLRSSVEEGWIGQNVRAPLRLAR